MGFWQRLSLVKPADSGLSSVVKSLKAVIPRNMIWPLLFYAASFSSPECSQKLLQFKHITVNDGISSSIVSSITQDYKGFMWMGTYDGLNRYDGVNFVAYKNNPSDSTSLLSNHVRVVFEDRKRNLLVGTDVGLTQYDRDLNRFINFRYDKSSALFGHNALVLSIAEDSIGNLWLATDKGLVYFDRENNTVKTYQHDPLSPESICDSYLDALYIDKKGWLWIGATKGLDLFIPQTGNFKHLKTCKTHNETIGSIYFLDIKEDREGNIWFGSSDGLFCLESEPGGADYKLVHFKNDPKDLNSLSNNRAKSLFFDREGMFWIGTENGGINLFDRNTKRFSHFLIDEFNPMSLNNESIHSIAQDRNDNLWFGTYGGGINLAVKNSDFIVHYKNLPGAQQSLSRNIVSGFVEDRYNRFWIATDGGGFNLLNEKNGRFTRFNTDNLNIKSNAIISIAPGDGNQIWMGTWEGGLICYDYSDNSVKSFTTQNSGIPENNIFALAKDAIGDFWLGTLGHGLIHYKPKEGTFTSYTTENSALFNNKITLIKVSPQGQIYLGATSGFQVFSPASNHFETYENSKNDSNSLSNNNVYDILIENDTCIWIATQGGLNLFNPVKRKIKRCYTEDSLQNKSIQGLTTDKYGMLWLTTSAGITRYDYHTNKVKNFTVAEGLQSTDFKNGSILTTENGTILAGGTNGFNIINPGRIPENKKAPDVVITDFHIFNQKVSIGAQGSPLKKHISQTNKIILTYKQSVLTFFFAVLDYTNPQKNRYAYMMEHFDKGWIYCGNRKEATYTNLDPGKYLFHVKGSNNDGVWNETGTTLQIIITPPWWKTKTAWFVFISAFFCLFLLFYFYRINQLNRKKIMLEKLVHERTSEIEEKNRVLSQQTDDLKERQLLIDLQTKDLFASNEKLVALNKTKDKLISIIAHDLKNPFTTILGFCEILSRRYETMDDGRRKHILENVYKSALNLFKLLETLLDWARTQTGNIKCNPEEFVLNDIVDANILFVENLANEKKVDIKHNLKNGIVIYADKNMLNTVIRNLITNAIKFTENGTIRIEAEQGADAAKVMIQDSGVGISPENRAKLFNVGNSKSSFGTRGESGTGLGLLICKEFIERHGGVIGVESEQGKGSTFYFTIPKKPSDQ
jgi:signal transduction histidine kinase/ligand-binding sensor domain-containing protein